MNIAEYAIQKRTVTLVFTLAAVIGGIQAYRTMGRLEDPEYTIKEAQIVAVYPGAAAKEVEQEVANEIEKAIQELGELDYVESTSYRGSCIVKVVIDKTYDSSQLPQIWDEMRRKVQKAEANLPPGARVTLIDDDFGDVYGVYLALHGDGYSYRELKEVANLLRRELLLVQDVSKISLSGYQPEAIYVEMNRDKMATLGITQEQIYSALQAKNMVVDAGRVQVGDDYIAFEPSGGYVTQAAFESLLISDPGAPQLIYLGDVATIVRDYVDPPDSIIRTSRKAYLLDGLPVADPDANAELTPDMEGVTEELEIGMPSICLAISTVSGGNVVVMGQELNKRFNELLPQIPVGIDGTLIYDQPKRVVAAVDGFIINLIQAIAIVIVVLLLFMGLKSGLLIGAILFITIIASFIFMKSSGVLLERISLGALVIALGMLVDNAIVITDGMKMKIEAGIDKIQAAKEVVSQNQIPLLGATVVAILAFGAIGLSEDSTGEYCRSLFTVVLISLLMSWITAVTITPLFCVALFKKKEQKEEEANKDPYGGAFFRAYRGLLELAIKLRYLAILAILGLFVASLWGFGLLVNSFFPASTQPQFYLDVWLPEGSHIRHTEGAMAKLEDHVMEYDSVRTAVAFTGGFVTRFMLTYTAEKPNPAYGQMIVTVYDYQKMDETRRSIERWAEENLPEAVVYSMRFQVGPGGAGKIRSRVSGPDHQVVRGIADEVKSILLDHPKTLYARHDWRERVKVVRPVIGEAQARRSGITRPMVAQRLKASFDGVTTGYLREGEREQEDRLIPIISRPPENERLDVDSIRDLQIESPTAERMIPLRQVVEGFETVFEDQIIWRRDRSPTVTVFADPSRGEASELFADVRPKIEAIPLPPGYKIEWGGEYEDSGDAQEGLAASIPGFLALMVLMVVMLFNNLRQPLIIWLTVPLALIGVVAGLLFFNQPFGFMALLGALSLTGMLIKNAVVLIDQININMAEEMPPYEAVIGAGVSRLRPVAMAALTTVLGMVPLLTDDFFIAMAVTIMVGLSFATVLTLVFVPVLFATFYGIKKDQGTATASA